jgi:hypothetical protein
MSANTLGTKVEATGLTRAPPRAPNVPGMDAKTHARVQKTKSWAGYGWFMTGGTFFPLPIFVAGYIVNLTFVGAALARLIYRSGLFVTTMGQPPPGQEKLAARTQSGGKPSFAERVHAHSPAAHVEKRDSPVPYAIRIVWFVFVGWWLGAIWVIIAWSVLLLPYPLLDVIRALLADLPSVMTLATPKSDEFPRAVSS